MSAGLVVRQLGESEFDRWSRFVAASPSGSIYALPAYLDILCSAAGGTFSIVGVFQGDELVGGIGLYLRPIRFGQLAARRSLLNYHSPVLRAYDAVHPSDNTARHLKILSTLIAYLGDVPCEHLMLHVRHLIADVRPFQAAGWRVRPDFSYVVEFADLPMAWSRVAHNLRRLIRRAAEQELVCTEDDDFDGFFRLHRQIHRRKHVPIYLPEAAFRQFVERLRTQQLGRLYHARLQSGESAAAELVLTGPHPVTHTVCAASDEGQLATGANPFLRWKTFEDLAGLGYTATDLTGAPYPHDVTRFKAQLGGDLVTNWLVERPPTLRYRLRRRVSPLVRKARRWLRWQPTHT